MTVTVLPLPPDLSASLTLRPLLEKAGEWLEDLMSDWPFPLTIEWYRVTNGVKPDLLGIRVSDEYATAHGVLTDAEMADPDFYQPKVAKVLHAMMTPSMREQQRQFRLRTHSTVGE